MKSPFARRAVTSEPTASKIHWYDVSGLERVKSHPGWCDEKSLLASAHTDIAGSAVTQLLARELATGSYHRLAQTRIRHRVVRISHSAALPTKSLCRPARLAVHTPRSVINPVTRFAGVTS